MSNAYATLPINDTLVSIQPRVLRRIWRFDFEFYIRPISTHRGTRRILQVDGDIEVLDAVNVSINDVQERTYIRV